MRVLIVEDDPILGEGLRLALQRSGFTADRVTTGEEAELVLKADAFDLAIVDLGLPQMDGMELIRRLRRRGHAVPVLILTARDSVAELVDGLEFGADDFMVKPFQLPELVARLRALIRRANSVLTSHIEHSGLRMDLAARSATLRGEPVEFTGREWSILECLLINAPKVVSKDRLLQTISGWDADLTQNAVEVYVSRIRTKLEPGEIQIRTVRGIGYRVDQPVQ